MLLSEQTLEVQLDSLDVRWSGLPVSVHCARHAGCR